MLSIIPVALVAVPLTVGRLIASSPTFRLLALLTMAVREATRGYPPGEGPLSQKMRITIASGDGIGGFLMDLSEEYKELQRFRGRVLELTRTESKSLGLLVEAALDGDSAIPALIDFIERFPKERVK